MTNTKNNDTTSQSVEDDKYQQSKNDMRTKMVEAGLSQEAIAEAEKSSDLRRDFLREVIKLKSEPASQPLIPILSSEDAEKYHKNSEEAIAEMLLLRKQAQQPSNTTITNKKPD